MIISKLAVPELRFRSCGIGDENQDLLVTTGDAHCIAYM